MGRCSTAAATDSIGKKWTIPLLQEIEKNGKPGFNILLKRIGKVSPKVLAARLKELESQGIIHRTLVQETPEKTAYNLTEKGRDLYAILITLKRWNERYDPEASGCSVKSCSECGRYLLKE